MNKKYFTLLILLVVMFQLAACNEGTKKSPKSSQNISSSKQLVRFFHDKERISMRFPGNWEVEVDPANEQTGVARHFTMLFSATSPLENKDDEFQERIGIMVVDLEKFQQLVAIEQMKQKEEGYNREGALSKIHESGFTTIDDVVARWVISKSYESDKEKVTLRQMGYDIKKNGKIYKIGFVGEASKFPSYRPLVERVARTIRIF